MRIVLVLLGGLLATALPCAGPCAARDDGPRGRFSTSQPDASGLIEARAAKAAEQQALRNAHFDAQVKRITGTICLGCAAPTAARPSRR